MRWSAQQVPLAGPQSRRRKSRSSSLQRMRYPKRAVALHLEGFMKPPSTARSLLALAGFVAATVSAANSGAKFSRNKSKLWYRTLNKPAFTPPNKVFPIVWTTLYALMAWSGWRVWRLRPISAALRWPHSLERANGGECRMVKALFRRTGAGDRPG